MQEKSYRPEIDGLRAIAVVIVVLFHAFPDVLRGGFIGVDVFFVISGYLITGILAREAFSGGISITNFYARRVRRIMPALLVVMFSVMAAGIILLLGPEIADLSLQLVGSTLFSANVLFWLQSGYFDAASLTKPFLHIWSLGVEEQFYLLWPLVLVACGSIRKKIVWAAVSVMIISFICNIVTVEHHQSAAFYLPFSRLWELAAGAFVATCTRVFQCCDRKALAVQLTGLMLVLGSSLFISEKSLFPGWWAILPVVGAVLVIGYGGRNSIVDRVLSTRAMVFVGLISYPIYLWHWPLLSFAHILSGGTPSAVLRLAAVAAGIVLAWLTFRLVELPARRALSENTAFVLLIPLVLISMLGTLVFVEAKAGKVFNKPLLENLGGNTVGGGIGYIDIATATMGAGYEWLERGCGVSAEEDKEIRDCYTDRREPPTFAVWGDSHANALMPGLLRESKEGGRWVQVGAGGCPPLGGGIVRVFPGEPGYDTPVICTKANVVALRMLERSQTIKSVLLVTASRMVTPVFYSNAPGSSAYENAIVEGVSAAAIALHAAGKSVYFLLDNPTFANPKECVDRRIEFTSQNSGRCVKTLAQHQKESVKYMELVNRMREKAPFLQLIDSTSVLCRKGECAIGIDGRFLYTDGDHLSDFGNGLVANLVIDRMNNSAK